MSDLLGLLAAAAIRGGEAPPPPPPFSPADIMQAWWDVELGPISYGTSPAVSQIDDRTGNGRHLTQATAERQGSRNATINGRNALSVDGNDVYLPGITNQVSFSFFAGLTVSSVAVTLLLRSGANTATQNGLAIRFNNSSGDGYLQVLMSDGVARYEANRAPGSIAVSTKYLLEVHCSGVDEPDNLIIGINGDLTTHSASRLATGSNAYTLFASNTSGGNGMAGAFALGGLAWPMLSPEDRGLVREYMASETILDITL